jgi:hypothetical protein
MTRGHCGNSGLQQNLMDQKLLIKQNFCYIKWIFDWSTSFALRSIQFIRRLSLFYAHITDEYVYVKRVLPDNKQHTDLCVSPAPSCHSHMNIALFFTHFNSDLKTLANILWALLYTIDNKLVECNLVPFIDWEKRSKRDLLRNIVTWYVMQATTNPS